MTDLLRGISNATAGIGKTTAQVGSALLPFAGFEVATEHGRGSGSNTGLNTSNGFYHRSTSVPAPEQRGNTYGVGTSGGIGVGGSSDEQMRADEELARRLASCSGSSIDYARQLSTSQRDERIPRQARAEAEQRERERQQAQEAAQRQQRQRQSQWLPAGGLSDGAGPSAHSPPEMLYISGRVGSAPCDLLVDTGAQISIISTPLMRRLGLSNRLNTSVQGVAAGVGRARIIGFLPEVPIYVGQVEFLFNLTVLDITDELLILGLDQMRRFKCVVDLEKDCLTFGGAGGLDVPFKRQPSRMFDARRELIGCPVQ